MIDSVKGTVVAVAERIVVDVGPLSLAISVPQSKEYTIGALVHVYTHLHWHSEQGMQLFGFSDLIARELFLLIIECSGIGPKLALTMLGHLAPSLLVTAITNGNHTILASVPGIGTKKAEHLTVQLRHKVDKFLQKQPLLANDPLVEHYHTITQTLESLQYKRNEISLALDHVRTITSPTEPFDSLLRKTLQFLAQQS